MASRTEYYRNWSEKNREHLREYHREWRHKKNPPKKMVQHHIKYKEIHGVDEVVTLTESEHRQLHNRLRREGRCNIPATELSKISAKARGRSKKALESSRHYRKFIQTEESKRKEKARNAKYQRETVQCIDFHTQIDTNARLTERISYNRNTQNVSVITRFIGTNRR